MLRGQESQGTMTLSQKSSPTAAQDPQGARRVWRGTLSVVLPLYRRLLPTEVRAAMPEWLRRGAKRVLGIKDPIVRVQELRLRLNDLGFVEQALHDLSQMAASYEPVERQLAIWDLAVWHANRRTPEGSAATLELLNRGLDDVANPELRRREAILRTECHATLGEIEAGRLVVEEVLRDTQHADLHLAAANLHEDPAGRLRCVNGALALFNLAPVSLRPSTEEPLYDRLTVAERLPPVDGPKISVIVPTYNAADHIGTALQCLIDQTWQNLEVLVVDDLSTDHTPAVISEFSMRDPRIKLIRAEANRGSYVARNIALSQASGEFVTTHDADDWSHPLKLEIQARHLQAHPKIVANMSQQARATSELLFHRRGNPGHYLFDNMSSLMFRREPVLRKLGYWDSVRFGADSEFIERIRRRFGRKSVASLIQAGPLSFQRQSESSLTGSSVFGFHGFFMGARLAYHQASRRYHRSRKPLFYEFPQKKRPFAIPEPMQPLREISKGERRHFDMVIASDFRIPGRIKARNLQLIKQAANRGRRIGLIQMASYDFDPTTQVLPEFRNLEDRGEVQFLVAGEHVVCDQVVIPHPPVLEKFQRFMPEVEAGAVHVLVEEIPPDLPGPEALEGWLAACEANASRHFGSSVTWLSEDPALVRSELARLPRATAL
jgi:glycosyltransferase involved in cell wall biosynthesis